jgi:WD40 repeat protein
VLAARGRAATARCARCRQVSGRVNGRYVRRLRDAAIAGTGLLPEVQIRRFLLASAGDDNNHGSVRLWNPATGQPVGAPLTGHTAVANAVAFSRDGKLLASAGSDGNDEGGIVRLWNPATGQPVGAPMTGPTGVGAVAFSPDGKLLASASLRDGTARLRRPEAYIDGVRSLRDRVGNLTAEEWSRYAPNETRIDARR